MWPPIVAERETILNIIKLCDGADSQAGSTKGHINLSLDKLWIDGYVSFMGMLCSADPKLVKISCDGNIKRCQSDPMNLGNIF